MVYLGKPSVTAPKDWSLYFGVLLSKLLVEIDLIFKDDQTPR